MQHYYGSGSAYLAAKAAWFDAQDRAIAEQMRPKEKEKSEK